MRISDWSSDVCSSDLQDRSHHQQCQPRPGTGARNRLACRLCLELRTTRRGRSLSRFDLTGVRCHVEGSEEAWMGLCRPDHGPCLRSEEHTSELQSLMRISYAVFCLKKKKSHNTHRTKYELTQQKQ